NLFSSESKKNINDLITVSALSSDELDNLVGNLSADTLRDELGLVGASYPEFNREAYLSGEIQPGLFGAVLNNLVVRELLDCFVEIAPSPRPKDSDTRTVNPNEDAFSGFVFKIHANMDPKHRNRLAFVKIVSGTFEKNKAYM